MMNEQGAQIFRELLYKNTYEDSYCIICEMLADSLQEGAAPEYMEQLEAVREAIGAWIIEKYLTEHGYY